jgi:hypothetical protein
MDLAKPAAFLVKFLSISKIAIILVSALATMANTPLNHLPALAVNAIVLA